MKIFKRLSTALFLLIMFSSFSACNTSEGIGEDLEKAGQEIQDAAREVEKEIN